jgi:hypothetical protein
MNYEHLRIIEVLNINSLKYNLAIDNVKLILTIDFMYYHFLGLLELSPSTHLLKLPKPILAQLV